MICFGFYFISFHYFSQPETLFHCEVCDRNLPSIIKWKGHILQHFMTALESDLKIPSSQDSCHLCPDFKFDDRKALFRHLAFRHYYILQYLQVMKLNIVSMLLTSSVYLEADFAGIRLMRPTK